MDLGGRRRSTAAPLGGLGVGLRQRGSTHRRDPAPAADAEGGAARAEEMLERSFTATPEPMLVVDRGSRVVRDANPARCMSLLGVAAQR